MASVDVIILSWDRIDDTICAIESALGQTGVDIKVQVVDQGTAASELARLKAFCAADPRVELRCNTQNSGVPGGRNEASAMGEAPVIVALDNDAEFADPSVCARAAAAFDADPRLAAIGMRIDLFQSPVEAPEPDRSSWVYSPLDPAEWSTRSFPALQFVGAGHALRRDVFEAVGCYDARLFFMHEEVDLCERILNKGHGIEYRGDLGVRHKVSPERRVHWGAGRFRRHMRNLLYTRMKTEGFGADSFIEMLVQCVGGFRLGYRKDAIGGMLATLALIPAARRARRENPYAALSETARRYKAELRDRYGFRKPPKQPWDGKGAVARLIGRLRWETDFRADFQ